MRVELTIGTNAGVWGMGNILGQRIRERREALGINIEELGRRSGVSPSYISRVERGERVNVGLETVQKLAYALDTSMSYLVGETDDPSPPPQVGVAAHREGVAPGTPLEARLQLLLERTFREVREILREHARERRQQGDARGRSDEDGGT